MAMKGGKVTIEIDADTKRLGKGLKQASKEVSKFGKIAETAIGFSLASAAIVATKAIKNFVIESTRAAIEFESTWKAFTIMVGNESDELLERLNVASRETVSNLDLVRNANQAMLLGIDKEALPEMMEIARAAALSTGQSVEFMFQSIATGVGRQSRMILDNLGIIVSVEEANKDYADVLGKTTSELTDAEKKQAFLNKTMEQGRDKYSDIIEISGTASEEMAKFGKEWADLMQEIGEILERWITPNLVKINDLIDAIKELREAKQKEEVIGESIEEYSAAEFERGNIGAGLKAQLGRPEDVTDTDLFREIYTKNMEELKDGMEELKDAVEDNTKETGRNTKSLDETADWFGSKGTARSTFEVAQGLGMSIGEAQAEIRRDKDIILTKADTE